MVNCEDDGPGDFSLCLAMPGSTGESFLGSWGMLCHLRGLFSLLTRDGEPSVKDVFRGGVGESVNMLFLSNCSNSSDSEKTGLNITFKASSLSSDLVRKFFFVKGALFGCWSVCSTSRYFLGALGDYTKYGYHKRIQQFIWNAISYISIRPWFSWLPRLILHSFRGWGFLAGGRRVPLVAQRRPTRTNHFC